MGKKKITPQSLSGITNAQFWTMARAKNAKFASETSKVTSETFSEKGFEALKRDGLDILNEFFELSIRIAFQKLDVSRAKNPLAEVGLVEVYDTPNGGFVQRIAINSVKGISPAYKGLENYGTVDPFIIRKPEESERFFGQNFDYQSLISIQDFQVKQIFLSETGMGSFLAGIMEALQNGYTLQEYVNTKEAINAAINSTEYPLQSSQKIEVGSWTDASPSAAELKGLILQLKDLSSAMRTQAQTGMYNANGFETYVDPEDYVVLMRAGIKNRIQLEVELGAFNPDTLTIPFDVAEISDFGGLVPYDSNSTKLQPVYDQLGVVVGYIDALATINGYATKRASDGEWIVNITIGGSTADTTIVHPENVTWVDENAEVLCVVAQKGLIFENKQNPYTVTPIYNPRGMYTNYWANSPNNGINVDPNYNMIAILKPSN